MFEVKDKFDDKSPYRKLADAIILQAVDDYRKLLRGQVPVHCVKKLKISDVEDFFTSKFFNVLTNLDGRLLISQLRKEYKDECKTNSSHKRTYKHNR